MLLEPWQIELFGGLTARQGPREITRFRTQKTASLLAYLAYHLDRSHPRERLIDLFWPDDDPEAARHSLRTALSSLRHQLELPGVAAGSVVQADRGCVRLNPEAVRTDVAEFKAVLRAARQTEDPAQEWALLERAVRLYRGELLAGLYEDWIVSEQRALAELAARARSRLAELSRSVTEDGGRRTEREGEKGTGSESITPSFHHSNTPSVLRPPSSSRPPCPQLPIALTRFFGRQDELAHIRELLAGRAEMGSHIGPPLQDHRSATPSPLHPFTPSRLVTLTGPGGSGKTRLAIEAGRALSAAYSAAVWFVPLVDVTDAGLIVDRVADAIGLGRAADTDPLEWVVERLSRQPSLLLLDNFEQIAEDGASVVAELLARVPDLACLVTSRQTLGIEGEQELPVLPLPIPEYLNTRTPEGLILLPSVQLFLDRAQKVRPDFQLTAHNAESVASLCARLEGIPLAIELAATRAPVLGPAQMLEQLEDRFELLVSRRKDLPERHRTLRAAIDWSYRSLPLELQRFFPRLSVFRGGWTAEAAEAICGERPSVLRPSESGTGRGSGGRMGEQANPDSSLTTHDSRLTTPESPPHPLTPSPLPLLEQLRERSLITTPELGGQVRFTMLETLREFGWEQVGSEERAMLCYRHASYFLALAQTADRQVDTEERAAALDRVEAELDNLRAALAWAMEAADPVMALRLVTALGRFWAIRGHMTEGRRWAAEALALAAPLGGIPERAAVLDVAGRLASYQDDYTDSRRCHEESLAIARALGDRRGIARALQSLGLVLTETGPGEEACRLCEESLALWRELEDPRGSALALEELAAARWNCHDYADAARLHREALEVRKTIGDRRGVAQSLYRLGSVVLAYEQDPLRARALFQEALAARRELKERRGIAWCLFYLGEVGLALGDYAFARAALEEALELFDQMGERGGHAGVLQRLGWVYRETAQYEQSRLYLEESLERFQAIGIDRVTGQVFADLALTHLYSGSHLAGLRYFTESLRLNPNNGPGTLFVLATLHAFQGRDELAALLTGAADSLQACADASLLEPSAFRDRHLAAARARLGDSAYNAAVEAGRCLSFEQALEASLAPFRAPATGPAQAEPCG